jgi:hypothetical protein
MTISEMGKLSLKILAIYAFIIALSSLAPPISTLQMSPEHSAYRQSNPILLFVPAILLFVFSGFLWFAAQNVNSGAEPASSANISGITPEVLQNIAYSITGIIILVGTLYDVMNLISEGIYIWIYGQTGRFVFWLILARILIRLALGIWLVLGSNRLRILGTRLMEILKKSGE